MSSVLLPRSVETEEAGTPISWTGLYTRSVAGTVGNAGFRSSRALCAMSGVCSS